MVMPLREMPEYFEIYNSDMRGESDQKEKYRELKKTKAKASGLVRIWDVSCNGMQRKEAGTVLVMGRVIPKKGRWRIIQQIEELYEI